MLRIGFLLAIETTIEILLGWIGRDEPDRTVSLFADWKRLKESVDSFFSIFLLRFVRSLLCIFFLLIGHHIRLTLSPLVMPIGAILY